MRKGLRQRRTAVLVAAALLLPALGAGLSDTSSEMAVREGGPSLPGAMLGAAASTSESFGTDVAASLVIGQDGFASNTSGPGAAQLDAPSSVAFSPSGDLWVVDMANNRVLEYVPPFTTGMAASVALGQPSLTSNASATTPSGLDQPRALAFSPNLDLWVVDEGNSRVLEYSPPFSTGMDASLVLGQADFNTSTMALTASGLAYPRGCAFTDQGDLFVADSAHGRVLEFVPPFQDGMSASVVLGQPNFTSSVWGVSAATLRLPEGLAVSSTGALWVADGSGSRVLEYVPPLSNDMAASLVLGQATFATGGGGTTATNLSGPSALAFDLDGDLWVTDGFNSRVLEFVPPFTDGMAASVVLGQSTFSLSAPATSRTGLDFPMGIAFDWEGNLWVADSGNSRVLEYVPAASGGATGNGGSAFFGQVAIGTLIAAAAAVVAVGWVLRRKRASSLPPPLAPPPPGPPPGAT